MSSTKVSILAEFENLKKDFENIKKLLEKLEKAKMLSDSDSSDSESDSDSDSDSKKSKKHVKTKMSSTKHISFPVTINTKGDGLWTKVKKPVNVVDLELIVCEVEDDESYDEDDEEAPLKTIQYGSLHVHFDRSWDISKDGLIYTDVGFLNELKGVLSKKGIDVSKLGYSEQGRQGDDYVDFDVDEAFMKSWYATKWPFDFYGVND